MSLRDAYEELCDLAAGARSLRLREMGYGAAERARLEAMLAERSGDVFDRSFTDILRGLQPDASVFGSLVGRRFGQFTVIEPIGEGGSAAMFRAYRPAGSGRQEVALKVLRASRLSDDARRRFEREQAILARLSHPNIARFIEGGTGPHGLPYLAMELVRGMPITDASAANSLGLGARLRLVSELCRAMHAAHSSLIVHCDLKPTNVMLDDDGQLKVLDFGIARLVDGHGDADVTRTLALTPGYAAPEQFKPGPPHVAVDVFAIGVLLAELVSGRKNPGVGEIRPSVAAVRDGPPRPGLPNPATLAKVLRGDIDAIVAKATAPDPEDRYRSADALGRDIDRYLAGSPIEARKASGWHRAAKFVRRHRLGASMAAIATVSLATTTACAIVQASRARLAAARAEEQARRADAVRNLAFGFFAEAEPGEANGGDVTVAQAVERAIERLSVDRKTPPRVRIDLLMRLAVTLGRQGRAERAQDLLEDLHGQAVAQFGAHDLLALALLERIAKYEIERGNYESARSRVESLLADPALAASAELELDALLRSASLHWKIGDYARSLLDGGRALQMSRALEDPDATKEALSIRAASLLASGLVDPAIEAYGELVHHFRSRHGPVHADVSLAYAGLARAYRRAGRLVESEDAARTALRIDREVYRADHWVVANHLNALTMTLMELRKFDAALAASEEALAICRRTLAEGDVDLTTAKYMVGYVSLLMGRPEAALVHLREALAEHTVALGSDASDTLVTRAAFGQALASSGATAEGIRELDAAIEAHRRRDRPDHALLAKALEKRIRIALASGDAASAQARLPALDEASARIPASDRKAWCARTHTLHAAVAFARGDWPGSTAALDGAFADIASNGCGNDAIALEDDLLRVLVALYAGHEIDRGFVEATRARALALEFPPPEITALSNRLQQWVRE